MYKIFQKIFVKAVSFLYYIIQKKSISPSGFKRNVNV